MSNRLPEPGRPLGKIRIAATLVASLACATAPGLAQQAGSDPGCDFSDGPGAIWWGTEPEMSLERLAAYAAPVFWHSPDEPLMRGLAAAALAVPQAMPFEEAGGPVVYYQLKELLARSDEPGPVFREDAGDRGASVIDLSSAALIRLEYYAYYEDEVGLGAHEHDVEAVEFKIVAARSDAPEVRDAGFGGRCAERNYILFVTRVSAKAHGIEWFWNIVEVDEQTNFPMYLFVEEGKHGLATDKNSDGYFTPSYDVNVRVNDAWGVRDIIRSGGLFSGGYEAWMTKVRRPEHRVFPPLPDDSPLRPEGLRRQPEYRGETAVYELRPLPPGDVVSAWDEARREAGVGGAPLFPFVKDKEVPGWPEIREVSTLEQATDWVDEGVAKKSLSIALYADGGDLGVSWAFPFFIVRNLQVPMSGGYVLHRMYLTGDRLQDFGWMAMYANSASRWFDTYFAAGAERRNLVGDDGFVERKTDFVLETGLKFRAQLGHSPLKFLTFFTDFWGFRAGIKNYGFFDIDELTYVLEVGAGSF